MKNLYSKVGVEGKPTVFLFNDTQVAEESFLEDINNVLSSGEVPNLYKPEEFEEVSSDDASFLFFFFFLSLSPFDQTIKKFHICHFVFNKIRVSMRKLSFHL